MAGSMRRQRDLSNRQSKKAARRRGRTAWTTALVAARAGSCTQCTSHPAQCRIADKRWRKAVARGNSEQNRRAVGAGRLETSPYPGRGRSTCIIGGDDLLRHSGGNVAALLSRQIDRHRARPHAGHHLLRDEQRRLLACEIGNSFLKIKMVCPASGLPLSEVEFPCLRSAAPFDIM